MPIYVYRCKDCGTRLDLLLNVDHETPTCPVCDKPMGRVIQPAGLRIPGSASKHRLLYGSDDGGDDDLDLS